MEFFAKPRLAALLAAGLGAAVFVLLGLPLPILLGPIAGCLVFAVAGVRLRGMGIPGLTMRTLLGVAIGTTITPAIINDLPAYGITLAFIPLFVLVIGAIGYPFFRHVMKFNHATSFYSAMPGGLQDMLIFGEEAGGDIRAMSLIHATRVLFIVTTAPLVLASLYHLDLTRTPGVGAASLPLSQVILMIVTALAGWRIAERIGLFGASLLGPMLLATVLTLTGVLQHRAPVEMIWAAQFFIGIAVGSKYSGITPREIRVFVGAGLAYCLFLTAISLAFIRVITTVSANTTLDISLAFLPGGQAEMAMIAIVAGADTGFVVAHHLFRIVTVITLAPVFARLSGKP
jgi:membrane AbrB-like protein